jgi:hypothetical protein
MGGTFFMGIRDVIQLGDETIEPVKRLCKTSERIARYLSLSRWKRWLFRRKFRKHGRDRRKYGILPE